MANENGKKDYPPSVQIARLFQKKSASGAVYFSGRMGPARVVLLRSKDATGDDGAPIWNLMVQQAEQRQQSEERETAGKRDWQSPPARGGYDKQLDDESVSRV